MNNQQEINNLVNISRYHVEHAIKAVEDAESLCATSTYMSDLFAKIFSNLAIADHQLSIANDITESVEV